MRMDRKWQWHDQKAKVKSRIANVSLKKTWLQLQQQQVQQLQAQQQLKQQLKLQQLLQLMQFAYAV